MPRHLNLAYKLAQAGNIPDMITVPYRLRCSLKGVVTEVALTDIILDTSWTSNKDRSTTNVARIGNLILHDVQFAKDGAGRLFYYDKGVYKPKAEDVIAELYVQWLNSCDSIDDWKAGRRDQIVEYISTSAQPLRERPPMNVICLKNGLFDWQNQKLHPHSPKYNSIVQIPIEYNPNATCPNWDQFLSDIIPYEGGPNYLREIMAICLIPFTSLQKCVVLVGTGSNGKSTFLNGLQDFIGLDNICNIPLHTLTNPMEKFARAGLVGKLVNIFGDMSTKKIEDAANFKPLVGEDRITIEFKHKSAFYYTPFCKLIFSCNEVVRSDDDSEGYKRRFIHIPFTQRFKVDPKLGLELKYALSSPRELSGLLNRTLPLLPDITENGLTITPTIAGIIDEWCPIPEDTKSFLLKHLTLDPDGYVPTTRFHDWLTQNCPASEPWERVKVIRYIKLLFPGVVTNQAVSIDGKNVKCFRGVRIVDPNVWKAIVVTLFDDADDLMEKAKKLYLQ